MKNKHTKKFYESVKKVKSKRYTEKKTISRIGDGQEKRGTILRSLCAVFSMENEIYQKGRKKKTDKKGKERGGPNQLKLRFHVANRLEGKEKEAYNCGKKKKRKVSQKVTKEKG